MSEKEKKKSEFIRKMNNISVKKKRLSDLNKSYSVKKNGKVINQLSPQPMSSGKFYNKEPCIVISKAVSPESCRKQFKGDFEDQAMKEAE